MTAGGVQLSVVVMHHPSRAALIPDLVRACEPLHVRVVQDPDPDGPPSALRTAKVAWAAIEDGASHHLVLQDDVVPAPGFAAQVEAAVAARPADGTTLYVNWDSPLNAYLVRRAALVGSAWAPLSEREWIPTLGLALPVAEARNLADRLAQLPDDGFWGDDDEALAEFFRDRGLRIACTVPHLVDHTDVPSLAGNELLGSRHGAVTSPLTGLGPDHWSFERDPVDGLGLDGDFADHVVELRGSRCSIRFVRPAVPASPRPGGGEFLEHPFAWYWYDWAGLVGVDAERVVDHLRHLAEPGRSTIPLAILDPAVATEVWAAGYLLGADTARLGLRTKGGVGGTSTDAGPARAALGSWIDAGLSRMPGYAEREAYVDLCAEGYRTARHEHEGTGGLR